MKNKATARICWIPANAGGRKMPPTGEQYATVASFDNTPTDPAQPIWSLVIKFLEPVDTSLCGLANVRFLAPEGPEHWLMPGKRFSLFEGTRKVATGEIISTSKALPEHNGARTEQPDLHYALVEKTKQPRNNQ